MFGTGWESAAVMHKVKPKYRVISSHASLRLRHQLFTESWLSKQPVTQTDTCQGASGRCHAYLDSSVRPVTPRDADWDQKPRLDFSLYTKGRTVFVVFFPAQSRAMRWAGHTGSSYDRSVVCVAQRENEVFIADPTPVCVWQIGKIFSTQKEFFLVNVPVTKNQYDSISD